MDAILVSLLLTLIGIWSLAKLAADFQKLLDGVN